jgi:hypothetical protein
MNIKSLPSRLTLDIHKMEAADKTDTFQLKYCYVELSNTHSRYMRMQHLQYNDIKLRGHACKGLTCCLAPKK